VTRIVQVDEFGADVDRIIEHLRLHDAAHIGERIAGIVASLELLMQHPLIGRPVENDARELVLGKGVRGHVARYRYEPATDTVVVMALRAQREGGFARN
jgi:toxin ParE1/3/4